MPGLRAKDRAQLAAERLKPVYPAVSELEHVNAYQMLIATILSAQTTDRTVNAVTPRLFARYPDAGALAHADPVAVEAIIKPTGFSMSRRRRSSLAAPPSSSALLAGCLRGSRTS